MISQTGQFKPQLSTSCGALAGMRNSKKIESKLELEIMDIFKNISIKTH